MPEGRVLGPCIYDHDAFSNRIIYFTSEVYYSGFAKTSQLISLNMTASKHHLYHRLQLAAHALKKAADKVVLDSADLTTAQAAVLGIVRSAEKLSQKEIATKLSLNESAVTAMVNRLLKLGYLERRRSERDARAWIISLSTEGQGALEKMKEPFGEINATLDDVLTADEMDDLVASLKKIATTFSNT